MKLATILVLALAVSVVIAQQPVCSEEITAEVTLLKEQQARKMSTLSRTIYSNIIKKLTSECTLVVFSTQRLGLSKECEQMIFRRDILWKMINNTWERTDRVLGEHAQLTRRIQAECPPLV